MKCSYSACSFVIALTIAGCVGGDQAESEPSGPSVAVSYQSSPLADVEVSLHAMPSGPVLAKAISTSDGRAHFVEVPLPEPTEYFVSLQSLGDGGWILDSRFAATNNGFRLKPLASNKRQEIKLPNNSVRQLIPNRRR